MRSSNAIIKNIAQKVIDKAIFGHTFHDLKYLEVGFFILVAFIVHLRAIVFFKNCTKNQFNVILSYLKQVLDNYVLNVPTCILFVLSSKI